MIYREGIKNKEHKSLVDDNAVNEREFLTYNDALTKVTYGNNVSFLNNSFQRNFVIVLILVGVGSAPILTALAFLEKEPNFLECKIDDEWK